MELPHQPSPPNRSGSSEEEPGTTDSVAEVNSEPPSVEISRMAKETDEDLVPEIIPANSELNTREGQAETECDPPPILIATGRNQRSDRVIPSLSAAQPPPDAAGPDPSVPFETQRSLSKDEHTCINANDRNDDLIDEVKRSPSVTNLEASTASAESPADECAGSLRAQTLEEASDAQPRVSPAPSSPRGADKEEPTQEVEDSALVAEDETTQTTTRASVASIQAHQQRDEPETAEIDVSTRAETSPARHDTAPAPAPVPPLPPSSESVFKPSTLALLMFTLTPLSLVHRLPLPATHNPVTLFCVLLFMRARPTFPSRIYSLLMFSLVVLLQQGMVHFHADAAARSALYSRMLTCATLGLALQTGAKLTVIVVWSAAVFLFGALLLGRYMTEFLSSGGTAEQLQGTGVMRGLERFSQGAGGGAYGYVSVVLPEAAVEAATAVLLARGYATVVVGAGGRVAHAVGVADVAAFSAAGAAGLAIGKHVVPGMWGAGAVGGMREAARRAADSACVVGMRVGTQVLVGVAVAERDVLGARGGVAGAAGAVMGAWLLLGLVGAGESALAQRGVAGAGRAGAAGKAAVTAWLCGKCWRRLGAALGAEAERHAVM